MKTKIYSEKRSRKVQLGMALERSIQFYNKMCERNNKEYSEESREKLIKLMKAIAKKLEYKICITKDFAMGGFSASELGWEDIAL